MRSARIKIDSGGVSVKFNLSKVDSTPNFDPTKCAVDTVALRYNPIKVFLIEPIVFAKRNLS